MSYKHIYVASCSLGADYNQTVRSLKEGESYNGTSLFLMLSPCIDWGFDNMKNTGEM